MEGSLKERLWAAACWRDYQLSMTERAFEAEQEQIETDFAAERAQLKESLLSELLSRRASLLEERERLAQDGEGAGADEDDSIIPSAGLMEQQQSQTGASRQSSRQRVKAASTQQKAGDLLVIPSAPSGSSKRRAQQSATSVLGMSTMLPDWEIYEDLNAISRAAGDETGAGTGAGGRRNAPRNPKAAPPPPPPTTSQSATTGNSKKRASAGAADSATASPLPKQAKTAAAKSDATAAEEKTSDGNNIYVEGGALWYCGSHYPKGSSFSVSFGEDPAKGFPVSLVQVSPTEVQVRKNSDGSKVRIPLEDLLSGSAMILAQDSQ